MGLALALVIAVIGLGLVSLLLRGLWHVRMPTFGTRIRKGVYEVHGRDGWKPYTDSNTHH